MTIDEGRSLLKDRQKIKKMTEVQKKKFFAGKGPGHLRWMEHRHGHGLGSQEYERHHDLKTLDRGNPYKIVEDVMTEISAALAHRYTMKAIKSSKDTENNYVKNIQGGKEPAGGFAKAIRTIMNRASGVARAQRRMNEGDRPVNAATAALNVVKHADDEKLVQISKWQREAAKKVRDKAAASQKDEALDELSAQTLKNYHHAAEADAERNNIAEPAAHKRSRVAHRIRGLNLLKTKKVKPGKGKWFEDFLQEVVSDNASNWGGWQGGMPGSGSALKGMKGGGTDDTGKIPPKKQDIQKPLKPKVKPDEGDIKLDGKKTKVIVQPTLKQSENDVDVKNPTLSKPDQPQKPAKQVKENELSELSDKILHRYKWKASMQMAAHHSRDQKTTDISDKTYGNRARGSNKAQRRLTSMAMSGSRATGGEETVYEDGIHGLAFALGKHLGKKLFGGGKKAAAPKAKGKAEPEMKANPNRQGPWGARPTGPQVKAKPPSPAQQKQADHDAGNAQFAAWKTKKADMHTTFKAAHDQGLDKDINTPYKSQLNRTAANAAMKARGPAEVEANLKAKAAARASNPLKQPSTPEISAPTEKPRVRVKAVSRPVEPPKPPAPRLKDRMSGKEFAAFLKTNPNAKDKIKLGSQSSG